MVWKSILKNNFTSIEKLADFLGLDSDQQQKLKQKSHFVLNLPLRLAEKIQKKNLNDPILLQFVPLKEEDNETNFISDPLQEAQFRSSQKLLNKYPSRSLIIATSACAMHCRYCFRRDFPYETERKDFDKELYLLNNIDEVILSGGDPLSLSNETLKNLLEKLALSSIKRIRFHTRFPIGIPERIDASLLDMLKNCSKQIWFVVHINHPRELDDDVVYALKEIQKLGIPILNQSVLLKGVNDDYQTLKSLSEKLVDAGITPYYLHQLDQVKGTAHFEVEREKGLALIDQLTNSLSGYAVPRYVQEIPGRKSKTSLKQV